MRDHRLPADMLSMELVASFGPRAEGREAAELLELYLDKVEVRLAEIASRRSRYFWMHVSRRIPQTPLHGSSPWTTLLYRTVFELALLKHGSRGYERDMAVDEYGTLVPREITYEDARDIYALEYLAQEHNHAATAFRRVGKGAVLVARDTMTIQRRRALDSRGRCGFSSAGQSATTTSFHHTAPPETRTDMGCQAATSSSRS
jgi:hypothetical protein